MIPNGLIKISLYLGKFPFPINIFYSTSFLRVGLCVIPGNFKNIFICRISRKIFHNMFVATSIDNTPWLYPKTQGKLSEIKSIFRKIVCNCRSLSLRCCIKIESCSFFSCYIGWGCRSSKISIILISRSIKCNGTTSLVKGPFPYHGTSSEDLQS